MMMQGIRKAGQSWLGKVVVSILFGVLIVSFAVWGIGDIFRGYGRTSVARVGKTEIGIEALRVAFQNELQRVSRQARRNITPEMARAIGLDRQVLSRLVTDATLDQTASRLGISVSDAMVAQSIVDDPNFKGPSGTFDRARFDDLLRNAGYNEQLFVREQRGVMQRLQLAEMVSGGVTAPVAIQEAAHRYRNERRSARFANLPVSAAGDIASPDEAALKTFVEERKASFRAPEYRSANLLVLTAEAIVDPASVSDADARARYESVKATRFGSAERRTIQQIVFATEEEAKAALARIRAGATFDEIATEKNILASELNLGTFTRDALFDKATGAAAFALPQGQVSDIVNGSFGPVVLRVTAIEPERIRSYEEVQAELKQEIALTRARDTLIDLHDKIEDERAGARPLAEIAKDRKLPVTTIGPIDRQRRSKTGQVVDVPAADQVLDALFRTDVGADNEALRLPNGGYVWLDVTAVEPSRDRSFEEVRAEAERQWRADEVARRLTAKARELTDRLDKGESFDAVAASAGLQAGTADDIARQGDRADLANNAIAAIFGTPVGKSGSAARPDDTGRVIFQVTAATVPPFLRTTQEVDNVARELGLAMGDELLAQYVSKLQTDLGVTLNEQGFRNATGASES